jgi:hypothetical protein
MTWQPGSIKSLPGHVKVKKHVKLEKLPEKRWHCLTGMRQECMSQHNSFTLTELVMRRLYGFMNVSGTVYYVGEDTAFETNIQDPDLKLIFDPIAKQWDEDTGRITLVMFRQMRSFEWLFL